MRLLAFLPLLLLAACTASGPPTFSVPPGRYAAAFDAARDELRDRHFLLERVDAGSGVITTRDKHTAGLATPWDGEQSTVGQEFEDLLNHQQRRVRVTFEPQAPAPDNAPPSPLGESGAVGRVEVILYRTQSPGLRPSSKSINLTTTTIDPAQRNQGIASQYQVPTSQDSRLAARIARDIEDRLRRAQ